MRATIAALALATALAAGGGCRHETCAAPPVAGPLPPGDANGDGAVDVADAAWIYRATLQGGDPPVCDAAVDPTGDGRVEPGDAGALLAHLFAGAGFPAAADGACVGAAAPDDAPCGRLEWTIDAPKEASGGSFSATVGLRSPELAPGPEGWSVGVSVEGCVAVEATAAGTAAALAAEDPAGLVGTGYSRAAPAEGGAMGAALLDWTRAASLPARDEPWPILGVRVEGPAGGGCGTCRIRVGAEGSPVEGVVAVAGRRYVPRAVEREVRLCAD